MKPYYQIPVFCASSSPRRRFILQSVFEKVTVLNNPFVEPEYSEAQFGQPLLYAQHLASQKLEASWQHHPELHSHAEAIWLAADTIVQLGPLCLGKPHNPAEAHQMLLKLSGQTHLVHTAVALKLGSEKQKQLTATTAVTFRALNTFELENYLNKAQYLDKAGAYAIQEEALCFIERIEGCLTNVVGLPLPQIVQQILEMQMRN